MPTALVNDIINAKHNYNQALDAEIKAWREHAATVDLREDGKLLPIDVEQAFQSAIAAEHKKAAMWDELNEAYKELAAAE